MKFTPKFLNPEEEITRSGGSLPHWEQDGACYFITFRLADSLPSELLVKWKEDRAAWLVKNPQPWDEAIEDEDHRLFSLKIETWLDQGRGECVLKGDAVREIVLSKILEKHSKAYFVHKLVIMPNHIHVLVSVMEGKLSDLMHQWKGATAYLINKHLGRSGALWQRDYFDRMIRDARHFERCRRYIANNPEKAGLRNAGFTLWGE
jgi:putative transposase